MQKKFATLVKEEIVKRFEDLTKEQIADYQNLVKTQQASLMSLSNIVNSFKNDFKIVEIGSKNLKDELVKTVEENRNIIEYSFECFRKHIEGSLREMTLLVNELKSTHAHFSLKDDLESAKIESERLFNRSLKVFYENIEKSNQLNQQSLSVLRKEIQEDNESLADKIIEHSTKLEEIEKKLNLYRIETESFRKEFTILSKSIYIQEKKIENLYTLIERLQKRLEDVAARIS